MKGKIMATKKDSDKKTIVSKIGETQSKQVEIARRLLEVVEKDPKTKETLKESLFESLKKSDDPAEIMQAMQVLGDCVSMECCW